ncbi:MAG: NAD(P)-dependent oxidoreductase [Candidatus Paracaedimonas acanthamoebae]|uniref:NAD(P)-dependent oxidoreductase n=1 Tax=Candidatus Paracaedimonas acanthamoebae TaxID=244581 RepID=A0A8J7PZC2_9PROT|nr:NAD(P)-dependent oxidoreductase [Candidatus Paracaedimonas acanthamoebae]
MTTLQGKTIFITGGSRGIGKEIALKAAKEGAHIVIAAKTAEPHPKLEGTIYTVAAEIEELGGKVLPLQCDIRNEEQIQAAVEQTIRTFGGIDVLINNASAIYLASTLETPLKRFDLMFSINVRGTFAVTQACLPYLKKAINPHVLTLSPPLNMNPKWFEKHGAYTMSKYGMSMCVLGMSQEFSEEGIAFNGLWPKTIIATAAVEMLGGKTLLQAARKPDIVAEAAIFIIKRKSRHCTGHFFIDEEVLREEGITDFSSYIQGSESNLLPDLFLD